eukprot:768088-Hanusia_phi.AAC.4
MLRKANAASPEAKMESRFLPLRGGMTRLTATNVPLYSALSTMPKVPLPSTSMGSANFSSSLLTSQSESDCFRLIPMYVQPRKMKMMIAAPKVDPVTITILPVLHEVSTGGRDLQGQGPS